MKNSDICSSARWLPFFQCFVTRTLLKSMTRWEPCPTSILCPYVWVCPTTAMKYQSLLLLWCLDITAYTRVTLEWGQNTMTVRFRGIFCPLICLGLWHSCIVILKRMEIVQFLTLASGALYVASVVWLHAGFAGQQGRVRHMRTCSSSSLEWWWWEFLRSWASKNSHRSIDEREIYRSV